MVEKTIESNLFIKTAISIHLYSFYIERVFYGVDYFASEIAITNLLLTIGFLALSIITFIRSKKRLVTNIFSVMNLYISFIFLTLLHPSSFPISISRILIVYFPVLIYLFFASLVRVRISRRIYIPQIVCSTVIYCLLFSGLPPLVDFIFLSFLFILTIAVCTYELNKKKSTFFQRYKKKLIIALFVSLLPFLILWVIPSALKIEVIVPYTYWTILFVFFLPISIMRIILKNEISIKYPFRAFIPSSKSFFVSVGKDILFVFLCFLLFLGTTLEMNLFFPFVLIAYAGKMIVQMAMNLLHIFYGQSERVASNPFDTERKSILLDLTQDSFYDTFIQIAIRTVQPIIQAKKRAVILFTAKDKELEKYTVIFSEMENVFTMDFVKKLRKMEENVALFTVHSSTYLAIRLYEEVSVGVFLLLVDDADMPLSNSKLEEINVIGQLLSKLLVLFEKAFQKEKLPLSQREKGENNDYSRMISSAIFDERKKYRKFLHDNILQNLLSIKMLSQISENPSGNLLLAIDQTIKEIRKLIFDAFPPTLYYLNMYQNISLLLDEYNERAESMRGDMKIPLFVLHCEENFHIKQDKNIEAIYRIIKELNDNAFFHSQAQIVQTNIRHEGSELIISVKDNGVGISEEAMIHTFGDNAKLGLISLKHDVLILGGEMKISSNQNLQGTEVLIRLPREVME